MIIQAAFSIQSSLRLAGFDLIGNNKLRLAGNQSLSAGWYLPISMTSEAGKARLALSLKGWSRHYHQVYQ